MYFICEILRESSEYDMDRQGDLKNVFYIKMLCSFHIYLPLRTVQADFTMCAEHASNDLVAGVYLIATEITNRSNWKVAQPKAKTGRLRNEFEIYRDKGLVT